MRVWALASYGGILALTACSAREASPPPDISAAKPAADDIVQVEDWRESLPSVSGSVSSPEVGSDWQPPLTRARPSSPIRDRSQELRDRLEQIRAQRSQARASLSASNPSAAAASPTSGKPNARPPAPVTQQEVTALETPGRPLPAVPAAGPTNGYGLPEGNSVQPGATNLPLLASAQGPQQLRENGSQHRRYSASLQGSPPDLTPPSATTDQVVTESGAIPATAEALRQHWTARTAAADLSVSAASTRDGLPARTSSEVPAANEGTASRQEDKTVASRAAATSPPSQSHRRHPATQTISLAPTGNGPQLHLPTALQNPRFSGDSRGTAPLANRNSQNQNLSNPTAAATTPASGERLPAEAASTVTAFTRETTAPLPTGEANGLPTPGTTTERYPDSLPLHESAVLATGADLPMHRNIQQLRRNLQALDRQPSSEHNASTSPQARDFSGAFEAPASEAVTLSHELVNHVRETATFSGPVRLSVPASSDQQGSATDAPAPLFDADQAKTTAIVATDSASDVCDRSRLVSSLLETGQLTPVAQADRASRHDDAVAQRDKLCSGDTKPLAQMIPDAATAGTPIPGMVESPTR